MFKFALAIGIAVQWLLGAPVHGVFDFGTAVLRCLMFTLVAWMVLEAVRLLVRAVDTLDDHAR